MGINNLLLTLPSHVHFLPFILQLNTSGNRCPALTAGLTASGEIEHWVFTSVVSCYLWTVCSDSVISVFFKRLLYFLLLIHIPDVNSSHIFTVKSHVIAALTFYLALLLAMLRFSPFISQLYAASFTFTSDVKNGHPRTSLKIPSPGCRLFSQGPDQKGQGLLAWKGHLCFNAQPWIRNVTTLWHRRRARSVQR